MTHRPFSGGNWDIHKNWVIAILVSCLIGVFSVRIASIDSLKDIINTGLALVSVALAVVAIMQTIASGYGLAQIRSEIQAEVKEIRGPAEQILNAANLLGAQSEQINSHAVAMRETVSSLVSSPTKSDGIQSSDDTMFDARTIGGCLAVYT